MLRISLRPCSAPTDRALDSCIDGIELEATPRAVLLRQSPFSFMTFPFPRVPPEGVPIGGFSSPGFVKLHGGSALQAVPM